MKWSLLKTYKLFLVYFQQVPTDDVWQHILNGTVIREFLSLLVPDHQNSLRHTTQNTSLQLVSLLGFTCGPVGFCNHVFTLSHPYRNNLENFIYQIDFIENRIQDLLLQRPHYKPLGYQVHQIVKRRQIDKICDNFSVARHIVVHCNMIYYVHFVDAKSH